MRTSRVSVAGSVESEVGAAVCASSDRSCLWNRLSCETLVWRLGLLFPEGPEGVLSKTWSLERARVVGEHVVVVRPLFGRRWRREARRALASELHIAGRGLLRGSGDLTRRVAHAASPVIATQQVDRLGAHAVIPRRHGRWRRHRTVTVRTQVGRGRNGALLLCGARLLECLCKGCVQLLEVRSLLPDVHAAVER